MRPATDPSTWDATDLSTNEPVRACLVAAETGAAARSRRVIGHSALVHVRDVVRLRDGVVPPLQGEVRGETFVILDRVSGPTLAERTEAGSIPADEAVSTVLRLGEALVTLEEAGTIHGAVVPDAIIAPRGEPPYLGLSGSSDAQSYFASPARVCGGGPSTHDDAWALLACLYLGVTGARPFEAESQAALARRILGGRPVPIKASTPMLSALQKVFDRGFSRTAGQRYVTVSALLEDLRAAASGVGEGTLPVPEPRPSRAAATTARRKTSPQTLEASRPAPVSDRPTEGAIPSARPSGRVDDGARLAPELPQVGAPKRSARSMTQPFDAEASSPRHTMPFGPTPAERPGTTLRPVGSAVAPPALELDVPLPAATAKDLDRTEPGATPPDDTESGVKIDTIPAPPPSAAPKGMIVPPEEPKRIRASDFPPAEDTRRFEREQIEQVWRENARRASDRPPPADEHLVATRPSTAGTLAIPAAPRPVGPQGAPVPGASRPSSRAPLLIAIAVGGLGLAAVVGWKTLGGDRSAKPEPTSAATTASTPTEPTRAAPPPSTQAAPTASHTPPAASSTPKAAASTSAPAVGTVDACVRAHYPEGSFDPNGDLSFVCDDSPLIKQRDKLQRALVAGSRGRGITPGMREYALYRWFELPAAATLRAACCPNATPSPAPKLSGACSSPTETVWTLALAAATKGADLEVPVRQYRRMAACMLGSGEAGVVGQTDAMTGGEETAFRALVERGRARPQ